ncbi:MAG TPA: ABC transporter substrate-binding protein/permease [Planctomycetota bacterium]|nr:ABC transporter substrate-binding protein/permease [Planctomycetota bacterium]
MKCLVAMLAGAVLLPAQIELPARYRTAGVLRWASDAEGGAPFVYVDPADPQHEIGFEVELAAELAAVLGVRMVRTQTPWEHLVEGLNRGDFDLVMNGFEPTTDRLPQVRFTRPYYIFQQQLAAMAGSTTATLADCTGRRVGCLGGSASNLVLKQQPGIETVVYEDPSKIYVEIADGRNFAALADLPIAMFYAPQHPGVQLAGPPFGEFFYAIAVRKDEPELQRALDAGIVQLLRDGALERVYRKWGMWSAVEDRLREDRMASLLQGTVPGESAAAATFAWRPSLERMLAGAAVTAGISVAAFLVAIVLGLLLALTRLYGPRPLQWLAVAYIETFRGTPVLVQLLFLYYGLGQIPSLPKLEAWQAGILGLGLNYAAYEAEVYRGAIQGIPRGQVEAALALSLSGPLTLRFVVLPQALRLALPASTNDFIALFKDSSIVMVITVVELSKQYNMLASASGRHIALGLVTCALYLAMSLPLAFCARRFERALERDRR